ncbi:hypothetical protein LSCM1_04562 [Leishmania martiniquensis]|uniref:Actin-like protein n=1 Tax=Leishmania martiniquensis TaxID=1580590 RepID=A0A836GF91_9TRYP|nr:hypothetical protein LSCM1_04562 [Leishmania martiniquensis]
MEATYILDCGHHTLKYTALSKNSRRNVEVLIKERRSECDACDTGDERFRHCVPQLLSDELHTDEDLTLLLLLDTLHSQKSKAALLYSCFEQFGCKRVCLHYSACTGLYAAGETSGVVVDLGYAGAQLTSVYSGSVATATSARLSSVGTRSVDDELRRLLRGNVTEKTLDLVKTHCCSLREREELAPELALPDGSVLAYEDLKSELYKATSAILYSTTSSVPDSLRAVYQKHSILFPDSASWLQLGGGSLIRGVDEVLKRAMTHALLCHSPKQLHLKAVTHAPVTGGIILSQLNIFKSMCIDVSEYEEYGPEGSLRMQVVDAR